MGEISLFWDFYSKLCAPPERSCSVTALGRLAFTVMIGIWSSASVNLGAQRLIFISFTPRFQLGICCHLTLISDFWYMLSNGELIELCQMSSQLINNNRRRVYPVDSLCMFRSSFPCRALITPQGWQLEMALKEITPLGLELK